jgi:isopenicillin-N N-acyltransferase-like protein
MTEKRSRKKQIARRSALVTLSLIILFLVYFVLSIHQTPPEINDKSALGLQRIQTGKNHFVIGNNWLRKNSSGLWELYVEGDGFERGVINGKLTKELAEYQETVFINQIKELVPSDSYLNFLKYFVAYFNRHIARHIPEEYLEEIYGVSLSASDKYDRLAPKYYRILNYHSAHDIGHALQDKNMTVGCTSFGAWKSATSDGHLLLGRNFDFFAGDDFAKNKIVCFTKPSKGNKFMYVTWAGFTGVVSGMNDKGLTVTINASKSDIPSGAATPISLLAKEILQYASNIKQAYEIAQKRETFVSESILVGSSEDKRSAIIEKSPNRMDVYSESADELVCSNHFRGPEFANDYVNEKNKIESSSVYRKFRMEQLLAESGKMNPLKAAWVLRNQDGINGEKIGLGNEKGINQLLAHHSIIFKPEDQLVWVSTAPYQLGPYVCYDLKKVFAEAPTFTGDQEITEKNKTIPADPFLYSPAFRNFILFRKIKNYIQFSTSNKYAKDADPRLLKVFENSNPDSYFTYWILGDYYSQKNDIETARKYYLTALSKEVATQKEARQISEKLKELDRKKENR